MATVTGLGNADPSGSVAFYQCGPLTAPAPCTAGTLFDTETLSGTNNPTLVVSKAFTPIANRYWCFAAVYSGDATYATSADRRAKECFYVVATKSTTVTRPGSKGTVKGKSNVDAAVVTGSSSVVPTGTVSFYACGPKVTPKPCTKGTLFDTKKLKGTNPALVVSKLFFAPAAGYWCFAAVYSGDSNYPGSSDTSKHECFFVTPATRPGSAGGGSGRSG